MRIYQTKPFARFARKAGLPSAALVEAARNAAEGRYDADLGGGIFKQRVARPGGGKSGGFRVILFFKPGGNVFFAHGFGKNEKANVTAGELEALMKLAETMLGLSEDRIAAAEASGELKELEMDDAE